MKTAVILAAGRGTRMGALTANQPKPLLIVRRRPLIEHILCGFARAGVERAIVVTGYHGEHIETALGTGAALGLSLTYCQQHRAEGTAKALALAQPFIGAEPFAVSWGDILVSPAFYEEFLRTFAATGCAVQLAVNEVDDPWQGAAVYVDEDWHVTKLEEKPPRGTAQTHWNNAGIFAFTPLIFRYIGELAPSPRGEYELPQAISRMVGDGRDVRAVPVRGFWCDVGTPADLARAEQEFEA
jgi:dTDP-glucose pyrophosphorylase